MTDPDYTAIAVLMDRSGSMMSIKDEAEGALRGFIEDQAGQPGRCTIRLAEFDNTYNTVYRSVPIASAPHYTLVPRGMTALLDAIGRLVTEFGEELAALPEPRRPGKVVVVVQTDGLENQSSEWTGQRVFDLITQQRTVYGWDFVFLGANQDAIKTGAGLGFAAGSSLTYAPTGAGAAASGPLMSRYVSSVRATGAAAFTDEERAAATEV
jgi:hypothetical protein